MDSPFGGPADEAYRVSGIAAAVDEAGGEMELMAPAKFQEFEIPDGRAISSWPIYSDVLSCDVLINVPIAKDHGLTRLSLGGKNLLGVILDPGSIHSDIGQRTADLRQRVPPDAHRGRRGPRPHGERPDRRRPQRRREARHGHRRHRHRRRRQLRGDALRPGAAPTSRTCAPPPPWVWARSTSTGSTCAASASDGAARVVHGAPRATAPGRGPAPSRPRAPARRRPPSRPRRGPGTPPARAAPLRRPALAARA